MACLLKSDKYPWARADAQQLHLALTYLYPTQDAAVFAASKIGLPQYDLTLGRKVLYLWTEILEQATLAGSLEALVSQAKADKPNSPQRPILDAVLSCVEPEASAEPRNSDGTARFSEGEEDVLQDEALLFQDDLTISVGKLDGLILTLQAMQRLMGAVCLLRVEADHQGTLRKSAGTGFRVGKEHVLTNHHVLCPSNGQLLKVGAYFGYETDAADNQLAATRLEGDVASVVAEAPTDWGVLRVPGIPDASPIVDLTSIAVPARGDAAYILQHPGGLTKRLAFVRNTVTDTMENMVHYLTDTQAGSSGAPVFDAQGKLIALHHRGGTPTTAIGKPPLCKNEGVLIQRVIDRLKANGLDASL